MVDKEFKIVQPTVKRNPGRRRGPLSSEQYNDFQDEVVHDIVNLAGGVNANANKLLQALVNQYSENLYLRRRIEALEESRDYREFIFGKQSLRLDRYIDFHQSENIVFPSSLSANKAASYKSQFGEISLPINSIENKFYNFSLRTREIVVPNDFSYEVVGQFDKADGNGTQDYEKGGKVIYGEPRNAFNGLNDTVWVRKVVFPLESDVDEVEVQITAVVPSGISSQANLIELVPFPEGSVDVTQIATSADLTNSFMEIDGFEEQNNITSTRYHFSPRNVEQVRVRLRSRNWREVDGKKVFMYGLRELGLKLVDYKKEFSSSDVFGENYTAVVKLTPPRNHTFNKLYRIDPKPNFLLEDVDSRHIRMRLSTTQDFSGIVWDSAINIPPQLGVVTGLELNDAAQLYAIYTMKFVNSSGGFNSPFYIGATPWAKGLGMLFATSPIDGVN